MHFILLNIYGPKNLEDYYEALNSNVTIKYPKYLQYIFFQLLILAPGQPIGMKYSSNIGARSYLKARIIRVFRVINIVLFAHQMIQGSQNRPDVSDVKMSECQTKAGNQISLSHSHSLSFTHSRHTEQLLFSCLCSKVTHSLSHYLTLTMSHSHTLTLSLSHSLTLHMLNNFCFHVYAQKRTLTLSHSLIHSLSTC